MCMIIIKPKGVKANVEHLVQANFHNDDGFGISYFDGKKVVVEKTLSFSEFLGMVEKLDNVEAIIHLRNTSAGSCSIDNAQPIMMDNGESFAHNGTVFNLVGHKEKSDSILLSEIICGLPYGISRTRAISAILGDDRGAIMHIDGTIERHGLWIELDKCYYSSDYYKAKTIKVSKWSDWQLDDIEDFNIEDSWYDSYANEEDSDETLVAVYGTLKAGHGNNRVLGDSVFQGDAITKLEFPMTDNGCFPYVFQEEGGSRIVVEIYRVDRKVLADLDRLEGVESGHYYRAITDVCYDDGVEESVNMYFSCDVYDGVTETISEWGV